MTRINLPDNIASRFILLRNTIDALDFICDNQDEEVPQLREQINALRLALDELDDEWSHYNAVLSVSLIKKKK